MLIIVSIIAILITLLLPSLRKAREASRHAVCMSNQKQIGMAIITYKEEGIGYLPQIDKIDRFLIGRELMVMLILSGFAPLDQKVLVMFPRKNQSVIPSIRTVFHG